LRQGKGKFPLHGAGWPRSLKGVRKNPTPAEGVAAWYENKETALGENREAGHANCSPRD
jgi:hypothetical protein